MELPLGPTFASIFMCAKENSWLDDCPLSFKPALYGSYIDDFDPIFRSHSGSEKFYHYVNQKHPIINFNLEHETSSNLAFLDCNGTRTDNHFTISVFRKPTFTGLCTNFFSCCSFRLKLNSVATILSRVHNVSSNYLLMHSEFDFLTSFFHSNGYPRILIQIK